HRGRASSPLRRLGGLAHRSTVLGADEPPGGSCARPVSSGPSWPPSAAVTGGTWERVSPGTLGMPGLTPRGERVSGRGGHVVRVLGERAVEDGHGNLGGVLRG